MSPCFSLTVTRASSWEGGPEMLNLPRPSGCSSGGSRFAAEELFSNRAWWLLGHVPLDLLIPLKDPVPLG